MPNVELRSTSALKATVEITAPMLLMVMDETLPHVWASELYLEGGFEQTTTPLTADEITVLTGRYLEKRGVLLSPGAPGAWDAALIERPAVYFDPVQNQYVMYYAGYAEGPANAKVGRATAANPLGPWAKDAANPVFVSSGSGPDIGGVTGPIPFLQGNTEWMFYIGFTGTGYEAGTKSLCLASRPRVGSNWGAWTYYGAIISPQGGSGWAANAIRRASPPIYRNGAWTLFFSADGADNVERIGYATAPAPSGPLSSLASLTWTLPPLPALDVGAAGAFDATRLGDPSFYNVNDNLYLAYYGYISSTDRASDGLASSTWSAFPGGWVKDPRSLLEAAKPYDSKYAYRPFIFLNANKHYHYYTAVASPDVRKIAVAEGVLPPANILDFPASHTNAAWEKYLVNVTLNATTPPAGYSTATKLAAQNAAGLHRIGQAGENDVPGSVYRHRVAIKAAGYNFARIAIYHTTAGVNSPTAGVSFDINLSTGVVSAPATAFGGYTNPAFSITSLGNGWYECIVDGDAVTSVMAAIGILSAAGVENFVGEAESAFGIFVTESKLYRL